MEWIKNNWWRALTAVMAIVATVAILHSNVKINTGEIKILKAFKETQIAVNSVVVTELKNISRTLNKIEKKMDK